MHNFILYVCTGNICRSPMAEAYLKKVLTDMHKNNITVCSAGIAALEGLMPSAEAVRAMQSKGIDISTHRSQLLTVELLQKATIILVMTENHRNAILQMDPSAAGKAYLLREFDDNADSRALDIYDPIGLSGEIYDRCFTQIKSAIDGFVRKILCP